MPSGLRYAIMPAMPGIASMSAMPCVAPRTKAAFDMASASVPSSKLEAILTHCFPALRPRSSSQCHHATRPPWHCRSRKVDSCATTTDHDRGVSADIDVPTHRVFDLFTDLGRATEHVPGIKRVDLLTPGTLRAWHALARDAEVFGLWEDLLERHASWNWSRDSSSEVHHHRYEDHEQHGNDDDPRGRTETESRW